MNGLQERVIPRNAVLRELKTRLGKDFTYHSGRILGSMCTSPHAFAKQVYAQFSEKNLGDPGLFPASAEIEQEAVTAAHIDVFLEDLNDAVKKLKSRKDI